MTCRCREKQTVEIVKVLYRGAQILILDEPTAVLTPQETDKLFAVLRNMKADGKAVVIITHKLHEVLTLSDRVSVLRKGEYVGTVNTAEATADSLTEMMVGQKVDLHLDRPLPKAPAPRLVLKDVSAVSAEGVHTLDKVSLHRLFRRDPGDCRGGRQRPEGAAGGHCGATAHQRGQHLL